METIHVELGARSYPIYIGEGEFEILGERIREVLPPRGGWLLTSPRVARACLRSLKPVLPKNLTLLQIADGERHKTLAAAGRLYRLLARKGTDRKTPIVLLGGGVIGDLGGFVAATMLRGLPVIQVPTSLVAQVDSAIGGKVGVDLPEGKNLVGAFHQPLFVFSDVAFLKSLPEGEFRSGLGEVVKYGVIRDAELFGLATRSRAGLLRDDPDRLLAMVKACSRIKVAVTQEDERETTGLRRILNFGHTFGHALERLTGYRRYSHGEAVSIGMGIAARISRAKGLCDEETVSAIREGLARLGLPTDPPKFPRARWLSAIRVDKKSEGAFVHFVFVNGIGSVTVTPVDPRELVSLL